MNKAVPIVSVLRLGYRIGRDPRITTHLGLVARAFGADEFLVSGDHDKKMFETIHSVNSNFGGDISTQYVEKPMKWMKEFVKNGGILVHLTMYGMPYKEITPNIPNDKPIAIVVGGPKVPAEVFNVSDFNVAIGNQPHSEVAALGIFMDKLMEGLDISDKFSNAKFTIIPDSNIKNVFDSSADH